VHTKIGCVLLALSLTALEGRGQLAVSSNDNKEVLVDGVRHVVPSAPPDTATIIDLGVSPPKVIGEVNAPGSWSAPPQSVAIAPDESIALVANSTRIDPSNPGKTMPDDTLSVIDLKASPPAVIATLHAGRGATGVSINPAGTLALVANRAEGTVSVFTIQGKTVTPAGKVDLGEPTCGPSLPVFTPDGKRAFVTRNNDHKVSVLSVNGTTVEYTKTDISANLRPYGIQIVPKGNVALVANIGNGPTGGTDTISVLDIAATPPRMVDSVAVGLIPEGIALSPDGNYLAADVMNGSNLPQASPFFHDQGILKILRVSGTKLTLLAEAEVGHWCEGVVWSKNQRTIVVQRMNEKALFILKFDGHKLTPAGMIKVNGGPAGIRTAEH
jgi:DNA-binding beta-propeller fold protein YncE